MAKTKPIADVDMCCMPFSSEDYEQQAKAQRAGHDPLGDPQRQRPEATRTTARPWGGDNPNRSPYLPTEDVSTPSLDEGISFRQSF